MIPEYISDILNDLKDILYGMSKEDLLDFKSRLLEYFGGRRPFGLCHWFRHTEYYDTILSRIFERDNARRGLGNGAGFETPFNQSGILYGSELDMRNNPDRRAFILGACDVIDGLLEVK